MAPPDDHPFETETGVLQGGSMNSSSSGSGSGSNETATHYAGQLVVREGARSREWVDQRVAGKAEWSSRASDTPMAQDDDDDDDKAHEYSSATHGSDVRNAQSHQQNNDNFNAAKSAHHRHHQSPHHHQQFNRRSAGGSATNAALSDPKIIECISLHLDSELFASGREHRQAQLRKLTLVAKAWLEPFSRLLWRNPYIGTSERAGALEACLSQYPARGSLILKLIFGEGSSTDVTSWPSLQTVPNILRSAPQIRVIGFDGLHNVDLEAFKEALLSRQYLEELRACDLMPEPWCFTQHLFDTLIGPCSKLVRLRLYNIYSEAYSDQGDGNSSSIGSETSPARPATAASNMSKLSNGSEGSSSNNSAAGSLDLAPPPKPITRGFQRVALNHCAIGPSALRNIFAGSSTSLEELYLELPMDMPEHDLLALIRQVGQGLRILNIHGFARQLPGDDTHSTPSDRGSLSPRADKILECAPNLLTLDFPECLASPNAITCLLGSKLTLWSFTCSVDVRPRHWLDAFEDPSFPSPASCRVYTKGWTPSEIRSVRLAAFKVGLNWLVSGSTLTELSEN